MVPEQAFENTYRIIFGECDISMEEIAPYLLKYQPMAQRMVSGKSGKRVALSEAKYDKSSRFISQDEIEFGKKPPGLSINEIKDLDSVIVAVRDRAVYSGNKVFGNS